uniref:Uncharacterized protein n=1 Tax=Anguilla anguilla TaxID=7936 RepID=A0A0E9V7Q2_ANGAN
MPTTSPQLCVCVPECQYILSTQRSKLTVTSVNFKKF